MPPTVSSPERTSPWEWVQVVLLVTILAWTTLGLGGYPAETMVGGTLGVAVALAVHGLRRVVGGADAPGWHPATWAFGPFLVYAALNVVFVTPVRWQGWQDWLGWAHAAAIFVVALNDVRTRLGRQMLAAGILAVATVGALLACYQRFGDPAWLLWGHRQAPQFLGRASGPFFVPNSLAALLVLVIPAVVYPVFRRGTGAVTRFGFGYLAALLLLALGLTISRGAWLALAVVLVAWPWWAGRSGSKRWRRALAIAGALVVVVSLAYWYVPEVRERLDHFVRQGGEKSRPALWRAAWLIFREHPVWGGGAGSYNVRFEAYRPEDEQKEPQWAHNDYLNTLADYGTVGAVLVFGAVAWLGWQCRRRAAERTTRVSWDWWESRGFSRALALGLAAFALHLGVDFHLKIPALAGAVALVGALVVGRAWPESRAVAPRWQRGAALAVAVGGLAGAVWWSAPRYRAEAVRDAARRQLDALSRGPALAPRERSERLRAAGAAFSRAVTIDPANAQAWADRAYVAAIVGHDEPAQARALGVEAEGDARRALALTRAVPEYWLRLGVALDMQQRWWEAGEATSEALRLAPVSATTWFYYAFHLSLNPVTVPRARAAVATSLRLDPAAPEAEALHQSLAAPH